MTISLTCTKRQFLGILTQNNNDFYSNKLCGNSGVDKMPKPTASGALNSQPELSGWRKKRTWVT